jgi:hypothetical protein
MIKSLFALGRTLKRLQHLHLHNTLDDYRLYEFNLQELVPASGVWNLGYNQGRVRWLFCYPISDQDNGITIKVDDEDSVELFHAYQRHIVRVKHDQHDQFQLCSQTEDDKDEVHVVGKTFASLLDFVTKCQCSN